MIKYQVIDKFLGYQNKKDITNCDPRMMIKGSQNVMVVDSDQVAIREGYTLDGDASVALTPVISSYDWNTSTGVERNFRSYESSDLGVLQVRYVDDDDVVTYKTIKSDFARGELNFAEWWSSAEAKDLLLIVDGSASVFMWSGGMTTYASATTNTLTKEGTSTWAEDRFLVAGTRQVTIGATTYTYTGGEGTTTLTGVTPDPTAGGHTAGDFVFQTIRASASTPAAGLNNDLIFTLNNYVYRTRRDVNVSKNTDYTSFTFSSPRLPGEGALLTMDSPISGFIDQEKALYIAGSADDWYQTVFTLSSDLTKERLDIEKLKSGPGQGAFAQESIGKIKNSVLYFNNEKAIDTLGRIEQINTPQALPISDPIKLELIGYDTTIAPHIKYYRNQTFVLFPSESKMLIYDHNRGFWQPPQIIPGRRLAIIDGELYVHSNAVLETYKLFDGYNDNNNPIDARAVFAYRNYGSRTQQKSMDEWYTEGYISANATLTLTHNYDYGGFTSVRSYEISGSTNPDLLFSPVDDVSLGKNPLGSEPLGSTVTEPEELSKFRVINAFRKEDFYEVNYMYSSNDVDYQWKLLAAGGNARMSTAQSVSIKV
jgi:hypothetical protein